MNFMRLNRFAPALLLTLTFLLPRPAGAQNADEIIGKVIAARGGLAKIRAIHSQRLSGKISFGDVTCPLVVRLNRPLKMPIHLDIQKQPMVRVYDGKSKGWANNPFAGKTNP